MTRLASSVIAIGIVVGLAAAVALRPGPGDSVAFGADPAKATPEAAFARAAELRKQADAEDDPDRQRARSAEFAEALRAAAAALPEVPVATGKAPARFTRLTLNRRHLGFDAIRFTAPRGATTWDLLWEFVIPMRDGEHDLTGWYIVPGSGDLRGFRNYSQEIDDPLEGVDLPHHRHVSQGLGGGAIRPGETYFIWFTFREGTRDVPMYVKMHAAPPPPEAAARVRATKAALVRRIEMPGEPGVLAPVAGGRRLLVAIGPAVQLVDVDAGRMLGRLEGDGGDVGGLAVTSDGRLAATGLGDGSIRIWDVPAAREIRKLEGHGGAVNDLAFATDGKSLVSGSADGTARLWDAATGRELRKLEGHTDQVLRVAFSPDGRRVATGASVQDPVGRIWDAASGRTLARLEGNAEAIYALAFSPDGRAVLTGGEDDSIRLFDAATGRQVRRFEATGGNVNGVGFLPGGRRAVSAGEDGDVVVWDVATSRELARFAEHSFGVGRLAIAPGGGRVFTGAADRSVRVWEVPASGPQRRGR